MPHIEQGDLRLRRQTVVRMAPGDAPILNPGRAGRTAEIQEMRVMWRWEDGAWELPYRVEVTKADRLKSGELGEPYTEGMRPDHQDLQRLVELARPAALSITEVR